MVTKTFEPLRPLAAHDDGRPYPQRDVLGPTWRVYYGFSYWPSRSYWMIPGTSENS